LLRLNLIGDTPRSYQSASSGAQATRDVEKFAGVLDLLVPVNESVQFLPAALAFCNGVATRFSCERASLGWLEAGYVHLKAMSRTERFDRKMAAAQGLEMAMEECLDQDEEILWPEPKSVPAPGSGNGSLADGGDGHDAPSPAPIANHHT